ncbi:MAG: hypothetical protein ACTSQI_16245 [Candidatus Helarchaeota archaeon]
MNSYSNEKLELTHSLEKIEDAFEALKSCMTTNEMDNETFEGKRINLLEQIKKIKYKISQLKESLNVKTAKEKLILQELNLLSERFQTEFDEDTGIATVFLSSSIDTHFKIDVDCSRYPDRPYIFISQELDKLFEGKLGSKLKVLTKWTNKKPPHIVEIFEEIEKNLAEFYDNGSEIADNREKLAYRRKIINFARNAEECGDFRKALNLYRDVLTISYELKDMQACAKYQQKIREVEKNLG